MKNLLLFLTLYCFVLCSCSTTRDGAVKRTTSAPEISLSSTVHPIPHWEDVVTNHETTEVISEEVVSEEIMYAYSDVPTENAGSLYSNSLPVEVAYAAIMREAATSTESRFAKKVLHKTAVNLEKSATRSNKGIFSKIRTNILNKFLGRTGISQSSGDLLAILSLVFGILALVTYYGSFLFGLAAIILGIVALNQGTGRRTMAIVGIILGAIAILFWGGFIILRPF